MIPSNRLDTYWDNLDHPPCACLKRSQQFDIAALATLEAAEQEKECAKVLREKAAQDKAKSEESEKTANVKNDAADKKLADAEFISSNAEKVLFASFVMFIADAVLFVAAWVTVWRLL